MAKSSLHLKVLYGEADAEVMQAQAASMKNAGHEVVTGSKRSELEQAIRDGSFDLVVLGPTLSRNDRHHLPYMIKKVSNGTRVLVMHTDGERHPYVDGNTDTGRSIDDLLALIAATFSKAMAVTR